MKSSSSSKGSTAAADHDDVLARHLVLSAYDRQFIDVFVLKNVPDLLSRPRGVVVYGLEALELPRAVVLLAVRQQQFSSDSD